MTNNRPEGIKFDGKKMRISLLPILSVLEVVRVLEFGAKKYAPDNWKYVEGAQGRYWDAAMRHMFAYKTGEKLDDETGLSHLAHAACCILFMLWFDLTSVDEE